MRIRFVVLLLALVNRGVVRSCAARADHRVILGRFLFIDGRDGSTRRMSALPLRETLRIDSPRNLTG
jgi:hypothetical protein